MSTKKKKSIIAFLLCLFGGYLGLHYFYEGNYKKGLLYLFTIGLFLFGYLFDIFKYGIKLLKNEEEPIIVPGEVYQNIYYDRIQKSTPQNYVVFDTETTGLNPESDRIIEISAIKYVDNKKVASFNYLVNPKMAFDPFITELTGIKPSDLKNQPTIDLVIPRFYKFIEDFTLIAHNAEYDLKMLACEAYRCGIPLCKNKVVDTVPLAKKVIPKEDIDNYKLETLKKYLKLEYGSHRALEDCETCAKVYQLYLTQKKQ